MDGMITNWEPCSLGHLGTHWSSPTDQEAEVRAWFEIYLVVIFQALRCGETASCCRGRLKLSERSQLGRRLSLCIGVEFTAYNFQDGARNFGHGA